MKNIILILPLFLFFACQSSKSVVSNSEQSLYSNDISELNGFFNIKYDKQSGKVFLEIDKLDQEFLYVSSLVTGIGSNDIGLDRGQFGDERVVKFVKNGPKIMLVQQNYNYRAISNNKYESKAVKEAFAESILWGFEILENNLDHFVVDATQFFLIDRHKVSNTLKRSNQGIYKVDLEKSAINQKGIKNFPKNTVIESILTLSGIPEGRYIRQVTPDPGLVTVKQRHSFIQIPDNDFKMRPFDPRSGFMSISFYDYATPIDQPIEKRYIIRHRLEKKNPSFAVSEAVEPIVYYLDPGVPEPIRSALLEGAAWWDEAYTAAGYKNAFQVRMLPEGADPMDVRYNLIQWVHRSTRGWSYGHSVIDPRTGEIIKGHVSLGSLRVRQDFLIAQGLLSPYHGDESDIEKVKEMALARIRQLAAHEVGHTLGLVHNYASSVNNRASVMDYPHPYIQLNDQGEIDLTRAYDTGIGEWDKTAIKYGYANLPSDNILNELDKIIKESFDAGLLHISDRDARASGGLHPYAHLWDNGGNAADELNRIIEVRKIALSRLGINSMPERSPLASLEDIIVPIYLLHRYQLEASSKLLGGMNYNYALKGDGQVVTEFIPPETQKMALDALLKTLEPEFLSIPDDLLRLIPPKPSGFGSSRENFNKKTGLAFDPIQAAEISAGYTLYFLLHPQRVSRLVEYHSREKTLPSFEGVLSELINHTIKVRYVDYNGEINRAVSKLVLKRLIILSNDNQASSQARAIALLNIHELEKWLISSFKKEKEISQKAHYSYCIDLINSYFKNPELFKVKIIDEMPMGSPIGMDDISYGFN